ncbi:MAG: NfeD family protein [Cyanobacteria bacterium P01_D01_bin.156]
MNFKKSLLKKSLDLDCLITKHASPSSNVMSYLESIGVVETPIRIGKKGRIRLCGVYWFACSNRDRIIAIGENVKVVGRQGTTLWVQPLESPEQLGLVWPQDKAS